MNRGNFFNLGNLFTVAIVLINSTLSAQETPSWLDYIIRDEITDPVYIETQKILDQYTISTVRITMDPDDYNFLLTNINNNEYLPANMTYESPTIPLIAIEQVGIRLRGAVARNSTKKSFKISFRAFGYDDRDFHGLRKLNLNCDFQDIHLMRAKTCTDLFRLMGVDAVRVGYSKLYINEEYRGLFANSEDIDKVFLQTRFGDDNGNLYKCDGASMQNGSGGYQLTTNEDIPDYSDILEFINVLNNTPADRFKEEIEKVFDVDEMLMYTACNVLLGAWDDYWVLAKNYYIYHDLVTDQFNYIPHDFDGSLGTYWYSNYMDVAHDNVYNWSPNSGRPMVEKLLEVTEYRDRYTHYLMLLCMGPFSLETMEPEIDRTADMIRETLTNDPYWGWNPSDFDKAFDQAISQGNVRYGMKEYIQLRRTSAMEQLEEIGPYIKETGRNPLLPDEINPVTISALVVDRYNVSSVTLTYKMDNVTGEIPMLDDGQGIDERAQDFIYTAQIPSSAETNEVQYFIEAANGNGRTSRFPAQNEWMTYQVNYEPPNVYINELLALNDSTNHDNKDEYDDWFELHNPEEKEIDLTGMYVSDNPLQPRKWRLGNLSIPPYGFLLLWADDDPEQGANHVGFKLSGNGEVLGLFDTDDKQNTPIDVIQFPAQLANVSFGRTEDGAEEWIFFDPPTPGRGNRDSSLSYEDLIDITDFQGDVSEPNNDSPSNETIENIIDNNVETKYLTFTDTTWIKYHLDQPSLVKGYAIVSANDVPERDPSNWEFQGWDEEGAKWITLHEVNNEPVWPGRFQSKEFYFSNKRKFNTYRLNIHSAHVRGIIQIAELEILGEIDYNTVDITDLEGTIITGSNDDFPWEGASSGAGSPPGEEIDKLIDNDILTKYLVRDVASWIEIVTNRPSLVTEYSITSANDAPARDPRIWELQGWDAVNENWVTLHSVEDNPSWEERFMSKIWFFENEKWYSRYRLDITAINFDTQNLMQMAELQIWGKLGEATAVEPEIDIPALFDLAQNYPNPFNPATRIQYRLSGFSDVMLTIYNLQGQHIKTLIQSKQPAGSYEVQWDATNEFGVKLASGVYFYQLQARSQGDTFVKTHKMILMK